MHMKNTCFTAYYLFIIMHEAASAK